MTDMTFWMSDRSVPSSARHSCTIVWVEGSEGGHSVGSSVSWVWTCCGVELGLPKVGLGLFLPPLRCGLGLVTLCFLLYSIIIYFEASGSPPQISKRIKIVGDFLVPRRLKDDL